VADAIGVLIAATTFIACGCSLLIGRGPAARTVVSLGRINWALFRGTGWLFPFRRSRSYLRFVRWFSGVVLLVIGVAWAFWGVERL